MELKRDNIMLDLYQYLLLIVPYGIETTFGPSYGQ